MNTQHLTKSRNTSTNRVFLIHLIIFFSLFLLFSISTPVYADPLPIEDVRDLQNMLDDLDGEYYLANDIDASETEDWNDGAGFGPIGDEEDDPFTGAFDGNGHVIVNLYINRDDVSFAGLFGYIREATIENVGLVGVGITGQGFSGGLAGVSYLSSITNCYATGSVNGGSSVGGLVGFIHSGSITDSYATGNVNGDGYNVGGLVGSIRRGSISNSYATGSVNGNFEVGGLAGGSVESTISNSFATGNVEGGFKLGGLAGETRDSEVMNCYATGSVSGWRFAGGLIGSNDESTVTNCYATGSMDGWFKVGGLVGDNILSPISNCYATGSVSEDREGSIVGGLVGDSEGNRLYTNNFWNTETSGNDEGTGNGDVNGITGATTEEMQDQATFEDVDWDFEDIWMMRGYPHFQWETDVLGGFLEGIVFDVENDSLLENATVTTSYGFSTLSDTAGYWYLERFIGDTFSVTVSKQGYNNSTFIDQNVEYEDTLEIIIGLLHPEIAISIEEFNEELPPNHIAMRSFTISDSGNGLLEWTVECRLSGESGVDPWELRRSYNAGQTVDDSRLQGVVFIDGLYYVTGGGNDTNMVYVLDMDGEPVSSFPQFGGSRNGMKDLAWDGELIWGVAEETVYGFNTNGDSITSFQTQFDRMAAIAWDPDRELLWISELTSDIHGYDREGNHDQQHELSRQGLRIYGLAYMPLDSTSLYIFNSPGDNRQVVHKMNPDIGDTIFVCELEPDSGGTPQGAFITDRYDDYGSWVFIDIANNAADDRIDIWQLQPNTGWMEVEPSTGTIEPDDNQELVLTLNTTGLDSTIEWLGELIFSQAVGGDETHIPTTMTISSSNSVADNGLHIPSEFCISSIYPNPFNAMTRITYSLPFPSYMSLQLFDLSGRRVATLFDDYRKPGIYTTILTANNLPSGLYFVRLKASDQVLTQKVMLIR